MGHHSFTRGPVQDNHKARTGFQTFLSSLYRFKETQSTAHAICNSLCLSDGPNYLNLSGQLIRNLTFLQGTHHLEYLVLDDCIALKDIFPISFCKNLVFLSLNRIVIHEGELLQSIIRKEIKTLSAVRATF